MTCVAISNGHRANAFASQDGCRHLGKCLREENVTGFGKTNINAIEHVFMCKINISINMYTEVIFYNTHISALERSMTLV